MSDKNREATTRQFRAVRTGRHPMERDRKRRGNHPPGGGGRKCRGVRWKSLIFQVRAARSSLWADDRFNTNNRRKIRHFVRARFKPTLDFDFGGRYFGRVGDPSIFYTSWPLTSPGSPVRSFARCRRSSSKVPPKPPHPDVQEVSCHGRTAKTCKRSRSTGPNSKARSFRICDDGMGTGLVESSRCDRKPVGVCRSTLLRTPA